MPLWRWGERKANLWMLQSRAALSFLVTLTSWAATVCHVGFEYLNASQAEVLEQVTPPSRVSGIRSRLPN
jgi:hypothetical protein